MAENRRMDRLLLPRLRTDPDSVEKPIPDAPEPLPRWQTVPLDAKFPVAPAPKGEVTFVTNKLGEALYKNSQRTDFDLKDPYNRVFKTDYQPLFDPNLKGWFAKPHVLKQMRRQNLVTKDGSVPVSLKEFNDYRYFIRQQGVKQKPKNREDMKPVERKKILTDKVRLKAELFGVQIKYKILKARQQQMEQEEEKRRMFEQKKAALNEREAKRLESEHKDLVNKVMTKRTTWEKKLAEIKERDDAVRTRAAEKLHQFEKEAQEKLNKLDYLREQKFFELDQKRKEQWRRKREYQKKLMAETDKQKQRVEATMRVVSKRYQEEMTRKMCKDKVMLATAQSHQQRRTVDANELYAKRMAYALKGTRYMTLRSPERQSNLTRQASMWMVEEVFNRLGLASDTSVLREGKTNSIVYMLTLDKAMDVAIKKMEGASALGVQQDTLSQLIHMIWRKVKNAYPTSRALTKYEARKKARDSLIAKRRAERKAAKEAADEVDRKSRSSTRKSKIGAEGEEEEENFDDIPEIDGYEDDAAARAEELARLFPSEDDTEEMEKMVRITMHATADLDRKVLKPIEQERGVTEKKRPDLLFFADRMRMTEKDAMAVEEELIKFLNAVQNEPMSVSDRKKIVDMCLRLLNHQPITEGEPCGAIERNPKGKLFQAFDQTLEPSPADTTNGEELKQNASESGEQPVDVGPEGLSEVPSEPPAAEEAPTEEAAPQTNENESHANNNNHSKSNHNQSFSNEMNTNNGNVRDHENIDNSRSSSNSRESRSSSSNSSSSCSSITGRGDSSSRRISSRNDSGSMRSRSAGITRSHARISEDNNINDNKRKPDWSDEDSLDGVDYTANMADVEENPDIGVAPNTEERQEPVSEAEEPGVTEATDIAEETAPESAGDVGENMDESVSPQVTETEDAQNKWLETEDFESLIDAEDIAGAVRNFLCTLTARTEETGACIPPSRLERFLGIAMGQCWLRDDDDQTHAFGDWLDDPAMKDAARSIIYHIKRIKFSDELQQRLMTAIISGAVSDVAEDSSLLTPGLIKVMIAKLLKDLEEDKVSLKCLENILKNVLIEYQHYVDVNIDFKVTITIIDFLNLGYDLVHREYMRKTKEILMTIQGWDKLREDIRDTLQIGHWPDLIHKTRVVLQLDLVSSDEKKKLREALVACGQELLELDFTKDLNEMLERIKTRSRRKNFKEKASITLSANAVVALLPSSTQAHVTSMTLLPGAQNVSQSANPSSSLGSYTLSESVTILMLDALARDMGENAITDRCQAMMAESLIEILIDHYGYNRDSLTGEALTQAFDNIANKLRCQVLGFADAKRILGSLLRAYIYDVVSVVGYATNLPEQDVPILDEEQSAAFIGVVTEAYVMLVGGVDAKLKQTEIKVDVNHNIRMLYVWRALAALAKEAHSVVHDMIAYRENDENSKFVRKSDSMVIDTLMSTVVKDFEIEWQAAEFSSPEEVIVVGDLDSIGFFLLSMLEKNQNPGFIPMPDFRGQSKSQQQNIPEAQEPQRWKDTPKPVECILKRTFISAAEEIFSHLVSKDAVEAQSTKQADYFSSVVFILERFTTKVYTRLWELIRNIRRKKIHPAKMAEFLLCAPPHHLPDIKIGVEEAIKVVSQAILVLEPVMECAVLLSKMVESLSRTAHGTFHHTSEKQPHHVVSVVPSALLALFMRSSILAVLRAISEVVSGGSINAGTCSRKVAEEPVRESEGRQLATAYTIVHNELGKVRDCVEQEKDEAKDLWTPSNVAGTEEKSVVELPIEIVDLVFARLAGVMETIGETDQGFEECDVPFVPSANELTTKIVNKVMSSVAYQVQIGRFPFIRINDLLKNPSLKHHRKISTGNKSKNASGSNLRKGVIGVVDDVSGNNVVLKSGVADPLQIFESDMSQYLLKHLFRIVHCVDDVLQRKVEEAIACKEEYDLEMRARAFTEVILDNVKEAIKTKSVNITRLGNSSSRLKSLAETERHNMTLSKRRLATPMRGPHIGKNSLNEESQTSTCGARVTTSCRSKFSETRTIPLPIYIGVLFDRISETRAKRPILSKNKCTDVMAEILKACLVVSMDFMKEMEASSLLETSCLEDKSSSESISILILEMIIETLSHKIESTGASKSTTATVSTNPYLSSYRYQKPDPYGPFYAEVVRWAHLIDGEEGARNIQNTASFAPLRTKEINDSVASVASSTTIKDVSSLALDKDTLSERKRASRSRGDTVRKNILDFSAKYKLPGMKSSRRLRQRNQNNVHSSLTARFSVDERTPSPPKDTRRQIDASCSKKYGQTMIFQASNSLKIRNIKHRTVSQGKEEVRRTLKARSKSHLTSKSNISEVLTETKGNLSKEVRQKVSNNILDRDYNEPKVHIFYHVDSDDTQAKARAPDITETGDSVDNSRTMEPQNLLREPLMDRLSTPETFPPKATHPQGITFTRNDSETNVLKLNASENSYDGKIATAVYFLIMSCIEENLPHEVKILKDFVHQSQNPDGNYCVDDLVDTLVILNTIIAKQDFLSKEDICRMLLTRCQDTEVMGTIVRTFSDLHNTLEKGMIQDKQIIEALSQYQAHLQSFSASALHKLRTQLRLTVNEMIEKTKKKVQVPKLMADNWKIFLELILREFNLIEKKKSQHLNISKGKEDDDTDSYACDNTENGHSDESDGSCRCDDLSSEDSEDEENDDKCETESSTDSSSYDSESKSCTSDDALDSEEEEESRREGKVYNAYEEDVKEHADDIDNVKTGNGEKKRGVSQGSGVSGEEAEENKFKIGNRALSGSKTDSSSLGSDKSFEKDDNSDPDGQKDSYSNNKE